MKDRGQERLDQGKTTLTLAKVACRRGGRTLVRGFDLDLTEGQSALLTGPNGVGKSSLLRLISGLLKPLAGEVLAQGGIALADEASALDREQSLQDALAFWARLDGVSPACVVDALAALALDHLADVPVRILSTGQRKRAALARVIAGEARIWLLDEPINGLDATALEALGQIVTRHLAQGGIVVAASHQPLPWPCDVVRALAPPSGASFS